jgi:parvulin-like peptidyl-prolyl isomerase
MIKFMTKSPFLLLFTALALVVLAVLAGTQALSSASAMVMAGILLLAVLAASMRFSSREVTEAELHETRDISDPIFVNETWILRN